MGRFNFEVNLPSIFEKKTFANFKLDEKFFEFSDYFLIDNYNFNCDIVIEKKNTFWQLDVKINGAANTYCDRCGDPLVLNLKRTETYFLKKEESSVQSHNVIYIKHSTEPINLEGVLKEVLFFVIPRKKTHKENDCNLDALKRLDTYQNNNEKFFLSDHLNEKLK